MQTESNPTRPRIRAHPSRSGIQAIDPVQDAQFTLLTPDPVDPLPCDTDRFYFPVDTAATLVTDTVETPYPVGVWIRDEAGDTVAEVDTEEDVSLPPGTYHVELLTTQIKVQFTIDGAVSVESDDDRVRIRLPEDDRVHVGVRSLHEQPAATVTTTDDPHDVMAALSTFGSALKTTSCERSFPTLRGHPPLVERGDALSIPDWLTVPDTGLTVEVPPSLDYVYPVASLAYYLGASVEPGPRPRLVADDWTYALEGEDGFETAVTDVLRRVFLLDCVTRTEGYYQIALHERRLVEDEVDLDFATLYDEPLPDQVRQYLQVPTAALTEAMPAWKLTVDIRPDAEYVSALPFLADELAAIRCPGRQDLTEQTEDEVVERVQSIFQNGSGQETNTASKGRTDGGTIRGPTRSDRTSRSSSTESVINETIFRPDEADSIEQAYVGGGIPVGASKTTVDAYYRRLGYEPSNEPQIQVTVVCNDEEMADENVVSGIYGTIDWLEFDITFEEKLTTDEMRDVLGTNIDFLHYVGHVDDEGIRCTDGYLDARELDEVNVSAFLLNACDSYEQGYGLVDCGAMAGLATVTDVVDEAATSVGRTVARLLNQGFSLASTMSLVREHEQIGHHYIVVGDASVSVVENESGTPYAAQVQASEDDQYGMSLYGYPRLDSQLGTLFVPSVQDHDRFYLNSGFMGRYKLTDEDLLGFLGKQKTPVIWDSELVWSHEFSFDA